MWEIHQTLFFSNTTIHLVLSLVIGFLVISRVCSRAYKNRLNNVGEPPYIRAKIPIPYIGHAFGLFSNGLQYFLQISQRAQEPIVTISIFGTRIYVVRSVKFMPLIERHHRELSSHSSLSRILPTLIGRSKRTFESNPGTRLPDHSFILEAIRKTKLLMHSKTGQRMNFAAAEKVSERFEKMDALRPDTEYDLFQWVKQEAMIIASESTYGPDNPWSDPKTARAFWDFEQHAVELCITSRLSKNLVSRMLKGFRGREALMGALESYLRRSRLSPCQPLLDLHLSLYGAQLEDSGLTRFEIASALGSFSNIVPVTFWTIFHIFSDVDLLAQIREEIWNVTCTVTSDAGVSTNRIDLRRLQSETVLFSAITEVLRYRATGVGIRYVTEDVHLENEENSYYLRKGAWLAIVNRGLHFDEEAWGADAKYFVANRFQGKTPHLSFRGFGSGVSTCCGKSFALHQIASFVAVLVMRYEIDPVDGIWKEPGQERRNTVAQVASPATEVAVRMRSREGMTGVNWQFSY